MKFIFRIVTFVTCSGILANLLTGFAQASAHDLNHDHRTSNARRYQHHTASKHDNHDDTDRISSIGSRSNGEQQNKKNISVPTIITEASSSPPSNNNCESALPIELADDNDKELTTVHGTTKGATGKYLDTAKYGTDYYLGLATCRYGEHFNSQSLLNPGVWYSMKGNGRGIQLQICPSSSSQHKNYSIQVYRILDNDCSRPSRCEAFTSTSDPVGLSGGSNIAVSPFRSQPQQDMYILESALRDALHAGLSSSRAHKNGRLEDTARDSNRCSSVSFGTVDQENYHVLVTQDIHMDDRTKNDINDGSQQQQDAEEGSFTLTLSTFHNVPNDVCDHAQWLDPFNGDISGALDSTTSTGIIVEECLNNNGDDESFRTITTASKSRTNRIQTKKPIGIWYAVIGTGANLQLTLLECSNNKQNTGSTGTAFNVYKGDCRQRLQCVGEHSYINLEQKNLCDSNNGSSIDNYHQAITWSSIKGVSYYIIVQEQTGTNTQFTLNLKSVSTLK